MSGIRSDALVVFGVTGDLAHKMIFPALFALVKIGALDVPIVGVAAPALTREELEQRVEDSIAHSGGVDDPAAFRRFLDLITYVSGDYKDAATFQAIKKTLGAASRPAHYLAIPPSLFGTVIKGSWSGRSRRKCARHRGKTVRTGPCIRARAQPRGA